MVQQKDPGNERIRNRQQFSENLSSKLEPSDLVNFFLKKCQNSKCSLFFSRKNCELMFTEMFCLVLIRSFPGSFCCVAFVYKDTNPHHIEVFSKIRKCQEKVEFGHQLFIEILEFSKNTSLGVDWCPCIRTRRNKRPRK